MGILSNTVLHIRFISINNHKFFHMNILSSDLDGTLSVSIPVETSLRPLLGGKVVIPCYFQDNTVNDPGAPTVAPLSHRIKWSYVTKEKASAILVASEGKIQVETEYLDRVTMVNYPLVPTDATLEITELRSRDSGSYRCEVMHGIEDNYDSVEVQVQGMAIDNDNDNFIEVYVFIICSNYKPFNLQINVQCFQLQKKSNLFSS